jgi:hypothetical protein
MPNNYYSTLSRQAWMIMILCCSGSVTCKLQEMVIGDDAPLQRGRHILPRGRTDVSRQNFKINFEMSAL